MLDGVQTHNTIQTGLLSDRQATVASVLMMQGVGLHSGQTTTVRIHPALANTGWQFVRVDLPDVPIIPANIHAVHHTQLSTELVAGEAKIRTVEHLLAALSGLGIDNARIEVNGGEIPLLDGSADLWVKALLEVGIQHQDPKRRSLLITEPLWVRHEDAFVAALPAPMLRFTYGIEFQETVIGKQWYTWVPSEESFATAIAPARTFGLAKQIDWLRSQGLIQGGSLDNALVCDEQGWLNPPLRFENEPVRHKLLDLVGDLSLLGVMPQAHFLAYKASHQLHTQLAQVIGQTHSISVA